MHTIAIPNILSPQNQQVLLPPCSRSTKCSGLLLDILVRHLGRDVLDRLGDLRGDGLARPRFTRLTVSHAIISTTGTKPTISTNLPKKSWVSCCWGDALASIEGHAIRPTFLATLQVISLRECR